MKYFTPERWLGLQNTADRHAWAAAQADWERAIETYREELAVAFPYMPDRLRRFAESECLHDATVLSTWLEKKRLEILLYSDPPDGRLFLLVYALAERPRVIPSGIPPEYQTPHQGWMYDEIGVEDGGPSGQAGQSVVFTHAILLSGGWEVRLRFRRFHYRRPEALLPLPGVPSLASLSAS
jgi:hypothetical protein